MWASFGLLGLLAVVLLGGAWLAIRLMEEQERLDTVIAEFHASREEDVSDEDWHWDDRRWFLVDTDDEPKWSGQ